MSFNKYLTCVFFLLGLWAVGVCVDLYLRNRVPGFKVEFSPEEIKKIKRMHRDRDQPFKDETNQWMEDTNAVSLGEKLFFEKAISRDGRMSCASCHDPGKNWTSERKDTKRDIPSLWNVAANRWYFWDGRIDTLWGQAIEPLENENEMGFSRTSLVEFIKNNAVYLSLYENSFGSLPGELLDQKLPEGAKPKSLNKENEKKWFGLSSRVRSEINRVLVNLAKSVAAYEATLKPGKSRFELFVEGVEKKEQRLVDLLNANEQRGLKIFLEKGDCVRCHNGPFLTDREFHFIHLPVGTNQGVEEGRHGGTQKVLKNEFNSLGEYSDDTHSIKSQRLSFMRVDPENVGHFKTPSLIRVSETAPYMHDKSMETLEEVVDFYSEMKKANTNAPHVENVLEPRNFNVEEKEALLSFLLSLTP